MQKLYRNIIKPIGDWAAALVLLVLTFPIWSVTTVLLAIVNDGKPFFLQKRPGKDGKLFTIIKFKTMTDAVDKIGELLPDAERLTPIGAMARKLSIDELPQLFNVIKGDMSIVGPRPLLPEYLPLYNEQQARRHQVKPGITGWSQVNGRNALNWTAKLSLDVYYVNNQSFFLDFKILLKTVINVLSRKGITDGVNATTTKFAGNE